MRRLIPAKFTAIVLVLVAALKALGEPVRPEDLWWHLAMGRVILATKSIPRVDSFSFTRAGAPFFDQAWLSQIILYAIYRGVGLAGLLAFNFAWIVIALYLVVTASMRRGASLIGAVLVPLVLAPLAMRGWAVRPQALCVPLFAVFVLILVQWRTDRHRA